MFKVELKQKMLIDAICLTLLIIIIIAEIVLIAVRPHNYSRICVLLTCISVFLVSLNNCFEIKKPNNNHTNNTTTNTSNQAVQIS